MSTVPGEPQHPGQALCSTHPVFRALVQDALRLASSKALCSERRVSFLQKVPGHETFCHINAASVVPCENMLFSLQNLRARSNKDAKDQTTKNSLESEFSVPRPLCAPCGGGCCELMGHLLEKQTQHPAGSPSGAFAVPFF